MLIIAAFLALLSSQPQTEAIAGTDTGEKVKAIEPVTTPIAAPLVAPVEDGTLCQINSNEVFKQRTNPGANNITQDPR